VTRQALLGFLLIVFCVGGIGTGIARVAPGSNGGDALAAVVAALVGVGAFFLVLRVGRRGTSPWVRWALVPLLVAAFYVDRLPERWQLALLALAGGYVVTFIGTVIVRAVRLTR
jgi:hypothetical protein